MSEFKTADKYTTAELNAFLDELSALRAMRLTMLDKDLEKAQREFENMNGSPVDDEEKATVFDIWCTKNYPHVQAASALDGKTAKDKALEKAPRKEHK